MYECGLLIVKSSNLDGDMYDMLLDEPGVFNSLTGVMIPLEGVSVNWRGFASRSTSMVEA